jgi:hypothetical protein
MKKIYQNPITEMIHLELQRMMVTSDLLFGDPVDSATGAESRRRRGRRGRNDWDDEDEEEEW